MNPTFSRRSFVSSASFSDDVATPSRSTLPDVGKSIAPAKLSSVDFPHPLRPTSATNCPASTSSDTPSSARTGCPSVEYSLRTFCRERIGIEMKGAVTLRRHHNSQRVPAPIFSIHLCYVAEQDSDASAIRRNRDASTQTTYFVANAFSIAAVTSGE